MGKRRQPYLSSSHTSPPLEQSATFTHNRIIYMALRLPETKGNDFPVFFRINNFLLYGGEQHYVLQVKYFKL